VPSQVFSPRLRDLDTNLHVTKVSCGIGPGRPRVPPLLARVDMCRKACCRRARYFLCYDETELLTEVFFFAFPHRAKTRGDLSDFYIVQHTRSGCTSWRPGSPTVYFLSLPFTYLLARFSPPHGGMRHGGTLKYNQDVSDLPSTL